MTFSPYNSPIDPGFYSTLALFLMVAGLASSAVFIVKQVPPQPTLVKFCNTPGSFEKKIASVREFFYDIVHEHRGSQKIFQCPLWGR